jgi:hypothetical protein
MVSIAKKIWIGLAALTLFFGGGLTALLILTSGSGCENQVLMEEFAPGGEWRAVAFTRDCGAAARISYQLSILGKQEPLSSNDVGNVFVHEREFDFKWLSDQQLAVEGLPAPHLHEANVKGIEIVYGNVER